MINIFDQLDTPTKPSEASNPEEVSKTETILQYDSAIRSAIWVKIELVIHVS